MHGGWECLQNKSVRREKQAKSPTKGTGAGEGGKDGDNTFDQRHDSLVPSVSCLLLKKGRDRFNRAVILELHSE